MHFHVNHAVNSMVLRIAAFMHQLSLDPEPSLNVEPGHFVDFLLGTSRDVTLSKLLTAANIL